MYIYDVRKLFSLFLTDDTAFKSLTWEAIILHCTLNLIHNMNKLIINYYKFHVEH